MATGRGQFLLSLWQGLERIQPGRSGENSRGSREIKPAPHDRNRRRRCQDKCTNPSPPPRQSAYCPDLSRCFPAPLCRGNYFERLAPEIILKIFSFLDESSLFSVSFVNRLFHQLANDECQDKHTNPPPPPRQSACFPTPSRCFPVPLCRVNYFERLPPEIILKIFSFLDASSLFSVSFVNRLFHQLANDNVIWFELYSCKMRWRKWRPSPCGMLDPASADVQDVPAAVWKKLLFGEMGCHKDAMWRGNLRRKNLHTGMPEQTEQVLRSLHVVWEITLTLKLGKQRVYEQSRTFFFNSSVTMCWSGGVWPRIHNVYSVQLHGVLGLPTTRPTKPRWRSLISKTEVSRVKWQYIGTDSLVMLIQFDDGITVGVWRGTRIIAFIMATLHFHRLVEKSVLGALFCPYRPEELSPLHSGVAPGASVHGYTLLVLLHNSVRRIMQCRYSPVRCTREKPSGEFARLHPVHTGTPQKPTPISGKISFPWKAGELQGDIKNCCMITVSVLDEAQMPVWCISSAAPLLPGRSSEVCEIYDSEQSTLRLHDANGKLRVTLVWMQDLQLYFLINLTVRIRVGKAATRPQRHSGAPLNRR